jgi:hypothetical protein
MEEDTVVEGGEVITLSVGLRVTLIDVIHDAPGPEGLTTRFRFLAPDIAGAGSTDTDAITAAMEELCQTYALPRIPATGPQPAQIVISLSDRVVPFGEAAPDAVQLFEAFRIEDGTCIWEIY